MLFPVWEVCILGFFLVCFLFACKYFRSGMNFYFLFYLEDTFWILSRIFLYGTLVSQTQIKQIFNLQFLNYQQTLFSFSPSDVQIPIFKKRTFPYISLIKIFYQWLLLLLIACCILHVTVISMYWFEWPGCWYPLDSDRAGLVIIICLSNDTHLFQGSP